MSSEICCGDVARWLEDIAGIYELVFGLGRQEAGNAAGKPPTNRRKAARKLPESARKRQKPLVT